MRSKFTIPHIVPALGLLLVGAVVGHLASSSLFPKPTSADPLEKDQTRISAITANAGTAKLELTKIDNQGLEFDDQRLEELLSGLALPNMQLAEFLNSMHRDLRVRAWDIIIRQRLADQPIEEVFALALLANVYSGTWEDSPFVSVADAALARDPKAAIAMVRDSGSGMKGLLSRYAEIDPRAALAAAKVELAGTTSMIEQRVGFIFELMQKHLNLFSPAELADALPNQGFRLGHISSLARAGARSNPDATIGWIDSIENSILRNKALDAFVGSSPSDRVAELLPRLPSVGARRFVMASWGSKLAREEGPAAIKSALGQEDPQIRHAALYGVISSLSSDKPVDLITEVVRMTDNDEIPDNIWDLLHKQWALSPAKILAEDPAKRPHWLANLEEPALQKFEAEARKRLTK